MGVILNCGATKEKAVIIRAFWLASLQASAKYGLFLILSITLDSVRVGFFISIGILRKVDSYNLVYGCLETYAKPEFKLQIQ